MPNRGYCCDTRGWCFSGECREISPQKMFALVQNHPTTTKRVHHLDINGRVSLSLHLGKNNPARIKYFFQQLNTLSEKSGKSCEELLVKICKKGQNIRVINFAGLSTIANQLGELFHVDNNLRFGILFTENNVVEINDSAKHASYAPPISDEGLEKVIQQIDRRLLELRKVSSK